MTIPRFLKQMAYFSLAIFLASVAIFLASHYFMDEGFKSFFQKHLTTMRTSVDVLSDRRKELFGHTVELLAKTEALHEALRKHDATALANALRMMRESSAVKFLAVLDRTGHTLAAEGVPPAETLPPPMLSPFKSALRGVPRADILAVDKKLVLVAATPLVQEGTVACILLAGEPFPHEAFLDTLKRKTGFEISVFTGDVCSATTRNDAEFSVGTKLDNTFVATAVLEKGEFVFNDARILEQTYKTAYWPVRDGDGRPIGMWFLGEKIESFEETVTSVAISCLVATLVIASTLSFLGVIFFQTVVLPLEEKAFRDTLTGVNNRAGFEKVFHRFLTQLKKPGALFLLDLDNFKQLNDCLGHPVGDICLKQVGADLKQIFRDTDAIARLGGDEFIVYAPTLNDTTVVKNKAQAIVDKITYEFPTPDGEPIRITASVGIALYPEDATREKELYHAADVALYESKRLGKHGFTRFTPALTSKRAS